MHKRVSPWLRPLLRASLVISSVGPGPRWRLRPCAPELRTTCGRVFLGAVLPISGRSYGLVPFPHKIGVIGFSAGGHMVAAISTHFDKRSYPAADAADKLSFRPDFAIACYPGHLWNEDKGFVLNPNVPVTSNTPPTFSRWSGRADCVSVPFRASLAARRSALRWANSSLSRA